MISYFNNDVFQEIGRSRTTSEKGTVYINHPHIVSVRKLINAFAAGDFDTWASFYSPEARFSTASMELNESISLEEYEQVLRDTYFKDDLKFKVEQVGYPDCIYYAQNDMYVVYSWWKMIVMKDGKKSEIPFMLSHDFNDDEKIDFARVYVSSNHMEKL